MIVPLHNHSEYSAIDGISTPREIAERVSGMGCPCCGLTDHGVVAGHLDFAKELNKVGVKPVPGVELYHGVRIGEKVGNKRDQAHLIALAMTSKGLSNLWSLVDYAAQERQFHFVDRVDWDGLEKFHEGIVFTSACVLGLVPQGLIRGDYDPLNRYLDILGDDFYMEISTYPGDAQIFNKDIQEYVSMADVNRLIVGAAQERGVPLVYGDDGHYAWPNQWAVHDAYVARNSGDTIYTPVEDRGMYHPPGAVCIKDEDTIRKSLSYLSESSVDEALANSVAIGERSDVSFPEVRRHLPVFVPDESPWVEQGKYDSAQDLFVDLVEKGVLDRYGEDPDSEVWDRAIKEMEIFLESGLEHYFLLDWDKAQFVHDAGIEMGPGRGSSAGCLVAYVLGITDVDPLPYDLVFERFWNPGRAKGFPDIDSDISKSRRKEVKSYLTRRWGHDKVRSIGTVMRMKPKSLVDTLYKAHELEFQETLDIKHIIENTPDLEILGVDQIGWSRESDPGKTVYILDEVGEDLESYVLGRPESRQEKLRVFLKNCEVLCNRVSSYGVHASGIVISDVDLPSNLPCRFAGSQDQRIPVTQFPMSEVDHLQFVKLDVLGLRTLDVLEDWRNQMKENHGVPIDWSGLEWEDCDSKLWEDLSDGFTSGIFQIESGYPKKLAERLRPRSVSDLSAIVALNRPGPIRSGAPDSFITRRNGGTDNKFDGRKIPILEENLKSTYGWFLQQENVIRYFSDLGYNLSDADAVRKILGKKQPEKWNALYEGTGEWEGKSYIDSALGKGLDKETADTIWNMLVEFGKYSFNLSHSVAYGTIGFRTAFAKFYGAPEFYMACIRNVDGSKRASMVPSYVSEARRKGIQILPPDIRYSQAEISVHDGNVIFGFSDVKGIGLNSAQCIVKLRDDMKFDISTPESLHEDIENSVKDRTRENKRRKKEGIPLIKGKSFKQNLRSNQIESLYTAGAWGDMIPREDTLREIQACEKEYLSVILTDNVEEAFSHNSEEVESCDSYEDFFESDEIETRWTLPGVVATIKQTKTKSKGEAMGIITVEYGGDQIEFVVFPSQWKQYKFLFRERTPGIFTLRRNERGVNFEQGHKIS